MSLCAESIDEKSLAIMRRLLVGECARRGIKSKSIDLALFQLRAFRAGWIEECRLAVLLRNLID